MQKTNKYLQFLSTANFLIGSAKHERKNYSGLV